MSSENVEIVRRVLAGYGETQQLLAEAFDPDFVWDMGGMRDWPGQREFIGVEGFDAFMADWLEPYSEWTHEIERILDARGDQVVVLMRQQRLRDSASSVDLHYALLYTFGEGLIRHVKVYTPPEAALEAAGVRD